MIDAVLAMLMSAGSSLGGQETVIHIAGKRSPGKEAARALARASCAPIDRRRARCQREHARGLIQIRPIPACEAS